MASVSAERDDPPEGPDLTFFCTVLENKSTLLKNLSNGQYQHLLTIHNDIIDKSVRSHQGFIVESYSESSTRGGTRLHDYFCVFGDVYNAVRCSLAVQEALHSAQWPPFYFELEKSEKLVYKGRPHGNEVYLPTPLVVYSFVLYVAGNALYVEYPLTLSMCPFAAHIPL